MAEEQDDPFKEFGGKAIKANNEEKDPFAEFGGKVVKKKSPPTTGGVPLRTGSVQPPVNQGANGMLNNQPQPGFDFSQQPYTAPAPTPNQSVRLNQGANRMLDKQSPNFNMAEQANPGLAAEVQANEEAKRAAQSARLKQIDQAYSGDRVSIDKAKSTPVKGDKIETGIPTEERSGNWATFLYNELLNGVGSMAAGLGDLIVQSENLGSAYNPAVDIAPKTIEEVEAQQNAVKNYREKVAPSVRDFFTKTVGADVDEGVAAKYRDNTYIGALGGLAQSAPAIALTAVSGGAGTAAMFLQSYDNALESINSTEEGQNLDDATKSFYAGSVGLVVSALEKYGLDKIFKSETGVIGDMLAKRAIKQATERTGGKVTGDMLTSFLDKEVLNLSSKYLKGGAKALDGALTEYATEGAQEGATAGSELLTNALTGKPVFDTSKIDNWEGFLKRVHKAGVMGAIGGGVLGGLAGIAKLNKADVDQKQQALNEVDQALSNENISPTSQQALVETKIRIQDEIEEDNKKINEAFEKLDDTQKERVMDITDRKVKIAETIADPSVPDTVKEVLNQENETLDKELSKIQPVELASAEEKAENQKAVDARVTEFQQKFPDKVPDLMDDVPNVVATTFERIEANKPTDITAVQEASDWLYSKYKNLTAMKKSETRQSTIAQIEEVQNQIEKDINDLESYKESAFNDATNIDGVEPKKATAPVQEEVVNEETVKPVVEPIVQSIEVKSPEEDISNSESTKEAISRKANEKINKTQVDIKNIKSLEGRMAELEEEISTAISDSNWDYRDDLQKEYNSLEKESEKAERESVFNVPLSEAKSAIDKLVKKDKEMPNGYGSFIEKRDVRESKDVISKYSNPESISNKELHEDFKEALMGNPTTWYADGLKLRESIKLAADRGINTTDLLNSVEKEFTKDGFDLETAKSVIAAYIKPILSGSKTVDVNVSKELPSPPKSYGYEDIDAMTNEKEVADNLHQEITSPTELTPVQQAIFEAGGFTTTADSYAEHGDKNNQNQQMAKSYFRKNGLPLDKIAKSLSKEGLEITPADLKEYMENFPNGNTTYSGRAKALQEKLFDMTGKKFNKFTVQKFRQRLEAKAKQKLTESPEAMDQKTVDIINEEGVTVDNIDSLKDKIEFIFDEDTFNNIKEYLNGTTKTESTADRSADAVGKKTDGSGAESARVEEQSTSKTGKEKVASEPDFETGLDADQKQVVKDVQKKATELEKAKPVAELTQKQIDDEIAELEKLLNESSLDKIIPTTSTNEFKADKAKKYADQIKTVLAKLFPNTKVKFYETTAEYTEATGRPALSAGSYNRDTQGISLNMELIRNRGAERTIYHEAIHPIVDAVYLANKGAIDQAVRQINSLAKADGFEDLAEHVGLYADRDGKTQQIEYVTEFLAKVLDGSIDSSSLSKSNFTKFKELINTVFKAIGIKYQIETASDIVKLSEELKKAIETGSATSLGEAIGKSNLDLDSTYDKVFDSLLSDKEALQKRLEELKKAKAATSAKETVAEKDPEVSGIKKGLVSDEIIRDVNLNKISDKEMLELGKSLVETGEVDPNAIVNEIARDGNHRALQPKEVVALIYHKATLDNQRRELLAEHNELAEAGESTASVDSKLNTVQNSINLFDAAAVITAQQQSMAFRLRKGLLDRDYNLVTQIEQYKKTNGGVIEPEVEARFKELDKQLTDIKEKLAKAEQRATEAEEKQALQNIEEDVKRSAKKNRSSLTPAEQLRKRELAKKYRVFNDVTRIVTMLAEKDFQEYAKLVLKEAKGDFQVFATELLSSVGVDIKKHLPDLYETVGGKGSTKVDLDGLIEKPFVKNGKLNVPANYIRDLVNDGVTDIDELSEKVRDLVEKDLPGITIREVRDAITDYGRTVNLSKDDTQRKINEAKRLGRLYSELEDLENKKKKAKTGKGMNEITKEEKVLKAKIKALERGLPQTPEEAEATEEQRRERRKESLRKYIAEKQQRLNEGNFDPRPKPKSIVADQELIDLQTQANKIRNEYDASHYENEMKNRPAAKKAYDTLVEWGTGLTRALVAGLDFGAFGVQGAISILSNNPKKTWKSVKESLKFGLGTGVNPLKSLSNAKQFFHELGSEGYERQSLAALRANPYYEVMKASGLAIQEPNAKLGERDDALQASVINKIWNAAMYPLKYVSPKVYEKAKTLNPYRAGERAYTGAINSLRTTLFLEFAKDLEQQGKTFETDPESYKKAAHATNNLTLRGRLRNLESVAPELATVFFAPRKVAAALSLTNPAYWAHMWATEPIVAKRATLKMAKFITMATTLTLAVKAFKDDDDEDSNPDIFNPLSPDFMKMRFGNTRMDLFGGLGQNIVLFARMLTGKYKSSTSTKVSKLGESTFVPSRGELLGRFASNKFAPTTQLVYKKLMEARGREMDWEDEAVNNVTPIWAQSIKELSREHPTEMATFLTFMSFIGGNISTYGTAEFLDPKKDEKLLELIRDKNASFAMKTRPNIDVIDPTTGEKREVTKEEYKKFKQTYGEYVKNDLQANYKEYEKMSVQDFEKELMNIKTKATKVAKEEVSGVTPEMLKIEFEGKTYKLTPDQLKKRMEIIKEESELDKDVLEDYVEMFVEDGMNRAKARIEAEKKFKSLMNTRSKDRLIEMADEGEIKLVEKED